MKFTWTIVIKLRYTEISLWTIIQFLTYFSGTQQDKKGSDIFLYNLCDIFEDFARSRVAIIGEQLAFS
jgi:hypothetical protein